MGQKYSDYNEALKYLNMEKLSERRQKLCLSFAKKCIKNEKAKTLFPLNNHVKDLRNSEKFKVNFAASERYKNLQFHFYKIS